MTSSSIRKGLLRRFTKAMSTAHTFVFRASGGKIGGRVQGMPVLLLTTTGRKTGKVRTTPLLYLRDGADIAVVASNGGNQFSPAWWLNLSSQPAAQIEIGRDRIAIKAREASAAERARLWPQFTAGYSGYAKYVTRTTREIPVVLLEPAGD